MSAYNPICFERGSFTDEEVARFWEKVDRRGPGECWPWKGAVVRGKYGAVYGQWYGRSLTLKAHRVAYTFTVGPIPEGLTLDHVVARGCGGGLCCNPGHMEPVTQEENVRRHVERFDHTKCTGCGGLRDSSRPRCKACRTASAGKWRAGRVGIVPAGACTKCGAARDSAVAAECRSCRTYRREQARVRARERMSKLAKESQ